jgi:hypothetical protein
LIIAFFVKKASTKEANSRHNLKLLGFSNCCRLLTKNMKQSKKPYRLHHHNKSLKKIVNHYISFTKVALHTPNTLMH